MKRKLGGILSILLLTLTFAFAQGTGSGGSDAATARDPNQATSQTNGTENNRGHDWGWIGLLGLIGLAGLRRNRRDSQMTDRDRNVSDIRRAA